MSDLQNNYNEFYNQVKQLKAGVINKLEVEDFSFYFVKICLFEMFNHKMDLNCLTVLGKELEIEYSFSWSNKVYKLEGCITEGEYELELNEKLTKKIYG